MKCSKNLHFIQRFSKEVVSVCNTVPLCWQWSFYFHIISLTLVLISHWSTLCPFLWGSMRGFNRCNWVYCFYINPMLYSECAHCCPSCFFFTIPGAKPKGKLFTTDTAPMRLQLRVCVCARTSACVHKSFLKNTVHVAVCRHQYLLSLIHPEQGESSERRLVKASSHSTLKET